MADFQLRYQTAATIEHYSSRGRPVSATCTGYISGAEGASASELWASAAVVLDTASTALTVAAAEGDASITVTSTSGFAAGRRYWITQASGEGHEVRVRRVTSATVLQLDAPLREPLAISSTIAGHRLTKAITTAHTASVRRGCRAEWELTWSDASVTAESDLFDIVLLPWALGVTEGDLERVYPGFGELAGYGWEGLARAGEDWVRAKLCGRQLRPDLCAERDVLKLAAVYRTLYLWTLTSPQSSPETLAARLEKEAGDLLADYLSSRQWYDTDEDLARYLGVERIWLDGEVVDLRRAEESPTGTPPSFRFRVE